MTDAEVSMSDQKPVSLGWAPGGWAWRKDLLAGVTVAAISLPQAMAYALIAGVDPRFGLYSAIVVTAIASVLGSSSHLINGPTNAISLVVFSSLAFFDPDARLDAYQAMFLLAMMAGSLQILISVFRLGDLTRYISESVVLGFMAGAGLLIALGQTGNLLGLPNRGTGHQLVVHRFWLTLHGAGHVDHRALVTSAAAIVVALAARKIIERFSLPRMDLLASLLVVSFATAALGWTRSTSTSASLIEVIGRVPAGLPSFHVPEVRFAWVREMSGSAAAIAVLGLLEALAISKSIASHTGQRLDYNRQCLAEGVANLGGGFFQCLPGSGSLTRSAINFQSGAVSRASGLVASAAVALVLVFFAPLARYIPKAALAGLLVVTAIRLIDWHRLRSALRASTYDSALVLITALSAIFVSVEFSILIGVAFSIVLFIPRAARLRASELVVGADRVIRRHVPGDPRCGAVSVYDLEGELFFGAAPELDRFFDDIRASAGRDGTHVVVLRLRRTRNPDLVCMERLEHFLRELNGRSVPVLLSGVRPDLERAMHNLDFPAWFPADRTFVSNPSAPGSSTILAVRRAYELAAPSARAACSHCSGFDPSVGNLYYMV
jgi:SulP family sulfate permease